MSSDRERSASGRFVSSGNAADADRRPAAGKPETTLAKVRRVLEEQLDRLTAKPHEASPAELTSIAKALTTIIEREEPTTAREKDAADIDELLPHLTESEEAKLSAAFDSIDDIYDGIRARLGRPVTRHTRFNDMQSVVDPLDYLVTLIGRRDEDFLRVVQQFVIEHRLEQSFETFGGDVERKLADLLRQWLLSQGGVTLYNQFVDKATAT